MSSTDGYECIHTIPYGCCNSWAAISFIIQRVRTSSIEISRIALQFAVRRSRNSQFVLGEALNPPVALPEQESSSCPLRAHTRVSIPRSVELGDPPLPCQVVVQGSRGATRIANCGGRYGEITRDENLGVNAHTHSRTPTHTMVALGFHPEHHQSFLLECPPPNCDV